MNAHTNLPWSEQYRIASKQWVELDGAARLLEETKTAVLAQRKAALGDIPDSHAEKQVKSSLEWMEFVESMVKAKTNANLAKAKCEYLRMKFMEWNSENANARAERRV